MKIPAAITILQAAIQEHVKIKEKPNFFARMIDL